MMDNKNADQYELKDLSLCSSSKLIFSSIFWQFLSCAAIKFIFSNFEMISLATMLSYSSSPTFESRLMMSVWNRLFSISLALHSPSLRFLRLRYFPSSKLLSKTSWISATASTSFLLLESVVMECTSVFLILLLDCMRWLILDFGF